MVVSTLQMTAKNHRGRTPITATSLALTMTEKRPISCVVSVIGSVAATSTPPGTSMAQASSPMRGSRRTLGGGSEAGRAARQKGDGKLSGLKRRWRT